MNVTALRLRMLRKEKHLSQQQVADALGITRTAYNKYESGVTAPSRKLRELMDLFGVSADYPSARMRPRPKPRMTTRASKDSCANTSASATPGAASSTSHSTPSTSASRRARPAARLDAPATFCLP